MEIFKDVVGYEGYYAVSNKGTVKSLERIIERSDGARSYAHPPRIMKQHISRGYQKVNLSVKGIPLTKAVHRLVALSFLDPKSELTVNHIDGNKLNNNLENLEFITNTENIDHAFRTGLRSSIGDENNNSTITEQTAREIIADIKNNVNPNKIMQSFGVTQNIVYKIKNKRTWKHLWALIDER